MVLNPLKMGNRASLRSLSELLMNDCGANETTTTTVAEAIPTIVDIALLELNDRDIILPLVTQIQFTGPGVVHQTPFIRRLTAETDDSLANQALVSQGSDETSPSAATVGVHGATVQLKEIAMLGSVTDLIIVAGTLIGQCISVRRDKDLAALFTSLTPIQGGANNDITVDDLYSAYKKLRNGIAPAPYNLVITPGQMYGTVGLIQLFESVADKIQNSFPGSPTNDVARNGWTGRVLGFDVYLDTNITVTSNNASGAAFSKAAFKYVEKRGLRIDVDDMPDSGREISTQITGSAMWGEAVLRNKHGVEMQFNEDV